MSCRCSVLRIGAALLRSMPIVALAVAMALAPSAAQAQFTPSNFVSFTLEGCRNDGSIILPIGGKYICPDAAYTTGNLGKGWNELDLVPHRLTTDSGNQSGVTTDYDVYVAADYQTNLKIGYDVISVPEVNAAKSHVSCTVTAGPQSTQGSAADPFGGGTDVVIYRQLTIHQAKNTTCVLDWYQRLALGAHLYPGSSLQSYMFDQVGLSGGKKTISIPVKDVLPQELSEDMAATRGTNHAWDVKKSPAPASVSFGNTCLTAGGQSKGLQITVSWEKKAANPDGPVTIMAHVYATNPAARIVTINVTDEIYAGTTQTNLLDTASAGPTDIPANTTLLVLTHTFSWTNPTDTSVNAVATATYTDKVTGIPIPGTTTASASATVQLTGPELNPTADINDVETISETPPCGGGGAEDPPCVLKFSADSFSGAAGGFDGGYTAGTPTFGPVSWTTSPSQSGTGSVTFNKKVYVPGPTVVDGTLSDTATLTGSNGFTATASASVTISADAKVALTIVKTIPDILTGDEKAKFTFHVKAGAVEVATPEIEFAAGETSKSVTLDNLDPADYVISEDAPDGWEAQNDQYAYLTLPTCAATNTFNNDFDRATAKVTKVTVPAGFEAGWSFDLKKGDAVVETVVTTGADYIAFTTELEQDSYSIVETGQTGWTNGGPGDECTFTVDYPADAGKIYSCQYTNTFVPSVKLTKTGPTLSKVGDTVTYTIKLENTSLNGGPAGAPSLVCDISDSTISFSKQVTLAFGGSDTSNPTFIIPEGAGSAFVNTATAYCHYPGLETVVASSQDDHSIDLFKPSITFDKTGDGLSKIGDPTNYTITLTNTSETGTPDLTCTVTDAAIGVSETGIVLAVGADPYVIKKTAPIPAGASDPYVNTASVSCSVAGFPNVLRASDDHSVNLFQPAVTLDKTGDALSKIGDDVAYVITVNNTSSADTPDLACTVTDATLGISKSVTLASGKSDVTDATFTIPGNASDPFINTASVSCSPEGFPNVLTASDDHSVNLFQPAVALDKTGDALSKIGDGVQYTITLNNNSSADTPNMVCKITDAAIGFSKDVTLASGGDDVSTVDWTIPADASDPYINTASVTCSPTGFSNVLTASDGHSVDLFQPAVKIEKGGDTLSKVGDPAHYTFTITNMSSADSPNLTLASISDNVIGDLMTQATAAGCDALTYQEVCSFSVDRTVQAGDPDPLVNTVNVLYHPVGFPNDVKASDGHSVNLFQPSVSIEKTGPALSKIGDSVTYHFKITNTSSSDSPALKLDSIVDDVLGDLSDEAPAACDSIAPGASCEFDVPWIVAAVDLNPADGQADDPVINTVTSHFRPDGFPNDIFATASHELNLFQPSIAFSKTADTELSKAGDVVNYTLTLNNTSAPDTPDMSCTIEDTKLGVNKSVTLASGAGDVTTVAYTVQAGDPDPLVNNASVSCSPMGFPNVLSASSSWSVNLFQPSVMVDKSGPALSKIGDPVTYHFKITNTSSADSPKLVLDSIEDDLLGTLTAPAGCDNLAPGAYCEFDVVWTVAAGSPDPVVNTVEVHYHPDGFPNDISDTDSHSLNLFQASITFDKSADAGLSKVGDVVNYTITLNNTSAGDTPDLVCTITDAKLGVNKSVTLKSGEGDVTNVAYTVQASDPDQLQNTASVSCSPKDFSNVLTASDSWTVNLSQPSVKVTKTGPAYSKAGDTATYNVTIENISSADSPNLVLDSFSDSLVAGITPPAACSPLAPGASCSFSYSYTVQAGDPDPLVNTATAHYHPVDFPNDITSWSTWSTDLLHPTFTVSKVCKAEPISQAGPAIFTITCNNTGDADLLVVPSEGAQFSVAAGASYSYDYSISPSEGPFDATVNNTVTGTVTLAALYGLSNRYTFSASDSCDVKGKVTVVKTVSGQPPAAGQTFTFQIRSGASTTSDGTALETTDTDASGNISFATELNPGQTYQICEWVMPGWNTNLAGDGPLFVPNSIIPPSLPNPSVNNMTVCADFTVTSGQTRTFTVDNTPPPGGRALTIGFWKNWASCAQSAQKKYNWLDWALARASQMTTNPPGGMVMSAQNAGSGWPNYAGLWYLVLKGDPTSIETDVKNAPGCQAARNLLDKTTIDGKKKKASDPLFNMSAQLVAAQANRFVGAGISGTTITNINRAVLLEGKYGFNGLTYSPTLITQDANLANCLATQLDNYNNNRPVSSCP